MDTLPRKKKCTPSTCQAHAPSRSPRSSDMGPFPRSRQPSIHPSIRPSVRVGHASDITLNLIVPLPLNPSWTRDDPSNGRQADRFQCIKSRNSHIHSSLSEAPREHARPTSSHTATTYKFFSSGLYIQFLSVFLKSLSRSIYPMYGAM